mmetsp:Transcript_133023/g.384740  ORF Transcript_133023/g.384740 Transcript_133023/m.384740 type:complete len:189 (+) Transcript_133023:2906-3472(+)
MPTSASECAAFTALSSAICARETSRIQLEFRVGDMWSPRRMVPEGLVAADGDLEKAPESESALGRIRCAGAMRPSTTLPPRSAPPPGTLPTEAAKSPTLRVRPEIGEPAVLLNGEPMVLPIGEEGVRIPDPAVLPSGDVALKRLDDAIGESAATGVGESVRRLDPPAPIASAHGSALSPALAAAGSKS